jgi:hypothetical protein
LREDQNGIIDVRGAHPTHLMMYKSASKFLQRKNIIFSISPIELQKERFVKVCPKCKSAYSNSYHEKCYRCNLNTMRRSGDGFFGDAIFYIVKIFLEEIKYYCNNKLIFNTELIFNTDDFFINLEPKTPFTFDGLKQNNPKFINIQLSHIPTTITINRNISKNIFIIHNEHLYKNCVKLCNQILFEFSLRIMKKLRKKSIVL